jgi:phosphoglycolate phosphatase
MLSTIIFDLDGTLTDSFDGIVDAFNFALGKHGHPPEDHNAVKALIGVPLEGMLERLKPELGGPEIDRIAGTYRDHYIKVCGEASPKFPQVVPALELLSDRTLVCASTKYTPQVEEVLRVQGIADRFRLLQGSEDIPKKPAPDLFRLVMERTGARPEDSAAVGDMTYDVEAAVAAGVMPVGVLTGIGEENQLREAGCEHVFPDLLAAADFIRSVE